MHVISAMGTMPSTPECGYDVTNTHRQILGGCDIGSIFLQIAKRNAGDSAVIARNKLIDGPFGNVDLMSPAAIRPNVCMHFLEVPSRQYASDSNLQGPVKGGF